MGWCRIFFYLYGKQDITCVEVAELPLVERDLDTDQGVLAQIFIAIAHAIGANAVLVPTIGLSDGIIN